MRGLAQLARARQGRGLLRGAPCRRERRGLLYLPLLLMAMLVYSVGRLQPHMALEKLEELLGPRLPAPLQRLRQCFRFHRAVVVDDVLAFEKALSDTLGERGEELAKLYRVGYEILGEKLAIVRELTAKALSEFRSAVGGVVSTVREAVRIVAMINSVSIIMIAFAAIVSSNTGALALTVTVNLAAAAALPIAARSWDLYAYTTAPSRAVIASEALHLVGVATAAAMLAHGVAPAAAAASAAALAASAYSYINDARFITQYRRLRLMLRSLAESRLAGSAATEGMEPLARSVVEAKTPPAAAVPRYGLAGAMALAAASSLLHAGVASALRMLEDIVEELGKALRRITTTVLEANAVLAGVEAAIIAAARITATVFSPHSLAGPTAPFSLGGISPEALSLYVHAALATLAATGYAAAIALTGRPSKNILAPATILALLYSG